MRHHLARLVEAGDGASSIRARVLLDYADRIRVSQIVERHGLNRPRVQRIIDQALRLGVLQSLEERRGRHAANGRPPEAIAWLLALVELPPAMFGLGEDHWTMKGLLTCARRFGPQAGHPSLAALSKASAYRYFSTRGKPFRIA